jgi:CRISPR-associated protein Cas2
MNLSGYRWMWVVAMFDLPVDTKEGRREYAQFRKALLKDGFAMMQFSVYVRHASSRENAEVHMKRVGQAVPPRGEVRILTLTDAQFERMRIFRGKKRHKPEPAPVQLECF